MKTKGLFVALVALMMCFVTGEAYAYDIEVENEDGVTIYYNYINEWTELEVTYQSYDDDGNPDSNYTGVVTIPATVDYEGVTYDVTRIGDDAFYGCIGLISVTIPNSVTSIGQQAFSVCSALTFMSLLDGVMTIGENAFSDCRSLTSVAIPASVTSIGKGAFTECSALTSVHISDLTAWCNIDFAEPTSNPLYYAHHLYLNFQEIKHLVIPEGVTSIKNQAFRGCSGLTSLDLGSVTSIGDNSFYGCSGLTSITIPKSVTSIKNGASFDNSSIAFLSVESGNTVYDSRGNCNAIIETSTNEMVMGCKHTLIPKSVTSIGNGAFYNCRGLTFISIPNSVKNIGTWAFSYCSSLTSVAIPSSVTRIGYGAFEYCTGLTSVHISDLVAWCKITFEGYGSNPLYHAHHFYLNNDEIKDLVIPNGLTRIGGYAFSGGSALTSLTIPNSVTSIEVGTFMDCTSLTSVIIPNSVTSIGSWAFRNCIGLTSVTIGSGIETIYSRAFANCPELADVYCYAVDIPETEPSTFEDSNINHSTLHVPASAINSYRTTEPWSRFGTIMGLSCVTYLIDGEVYKTYNLLVGETIPIEPEPTKEGYTFSGWSEIPETMPAHDVDITGTFTINQYTITFKIGDNVYETQTLDYGAAITAPEIPELTGYTFTWGEVPSTMPANDVTIIGEYQPNSYNVTYLIDGQFYAIFKVPYGSVITPPEAPERAGSTFTWGEYPETMPAHDIIIEGTYTDGIDLVQGTQGTTEIFTLDGKKIQRMQRGVNIVRRGSKVMKVVR